MKAPSAKSPLSHSEMRDLSKRARQRNLKAAPPLSDKEKAKLARIAARRPAD